MKKAYVVSNLKDCLFHKAGIISRKEMLKADLDREYQQTPFESKDDNDILILNIGESVVVLSHDYGSAYVTIFAVYTALQ